MSEIFLSVLNMSISASWIVLAVLLLRVLLKKAPKWITVLLWAVVAIRLICPFSFESALSLMPSAETISPQVLTETPAVQTGFPTVNDTLNPIIEETTVTVATQKEVNLLQLCVLIFSKVWVVGVIALMAYAVISYVRIRRKVNTAVQLEENVYQSENVPSPFVLGFIKPKIYLPFAIDAQDIPYVIAHEQAHIRRKDHWWKPLGFLLLAVHWFNPLMWLSYVLLCRDIEHACDEKVIKDWDNVQKADYSQALLDCSVHRRMIAACPLAFGEAAVKDRVKSVLSYKKPAFWIVTIGVIAVAVIAVCFLTDPTSKIDDDLSAFLEAQILQHHSAGYLSGEYCCTDFEVIGTTKDNDNTTVYMWVLYSEYDKRGDTIEDVSGAHILTAITVNETDGQYTLAEYWEPQDGAYYADSVKEKIPWYWYWKAHDSSRYIERQRAACDKKAEAYFASAVVIDGIENYESEHHGKPLTLEDVKTLSQKGDALSWEDFDEFSYVVTGSGLHIRHYPIDEMFSLWIGGAGENDEVMYIRLYASDAANEGVDIRTDDVTAFIEAHRDNPVVTQVSYGYRVCPVDNTGENYARMCSIGGVPMNAAASHTKAFPIVTINSVEELQQFKNQMKDHMDFSRSYADVTSFDEACEEYTDDYFARTTLYLVYATGDTSATRFSLSYAAESQGVLSLGITEDRSQAGDTVRQGWLMCIGIPNSDLQHVQTVEAHVNATTLSE